MVDRPVLGDAKELVPGSACPAAHVGVAGRIVGQHLQHLADGHLTQGFPGLDDGHGAEKPETVQGSVDSQGLGTGRALTREATVLQAAAACQGSPARSHRRRKYLDSFDRE